MVRRGVLVGSRGAGWGAVAGVALAFVLGAISVLLVYQLPARHEVDIGGYDAAYVQGFADAERLSETARPYLVGSDGSARWTGATSSLLFPQAGLPGTITLRLRGWRVSGPAPQLTVLLNGRDVVGSFTIAPEWQEYAVTVNSGLLKTSDFFLELRADTTRLPDDGCEVGVLLDRATYRVGPGAVLPYPAQLLYGALAAGLLWMLLGERRTQNVERRTQTSATPIQAHPRAGWLRSRRSSSTQPAGGSGFYQFWSNHITSFALIWVAILVSWFVLYRNQPPLYPYPLIGLLPAVDLGLAALLGLRLWQRPAVRNWLSVRPWLLDGLAGVGIVVWAGALWMAAQSHITLARPGVENDFRVFATRDTLERVFQADGFYNLGYPLLLWLVRPLTADNPFLAGRLIAVASATLLLAAGYWLARTFFAAWSPLVRRTLALLALLVLALSPLVVEYGLYVGSDAPFAALFTLTLALLFVSTHEHPRPALLLAAGLVGGATFLMRHLGLVLLPWGIIYCLFLSRSSIKHQASSITTRVWPLFLAGFLLAALPQIIINTWQTGQPLYNQQAKNIWLCVYGNCDWGRWDEAPNSIGLADVILRDPGRFLANWTANLRAFFGTGAEDTSEFGRAIQLRLLGWPANWLAIIGLIGWIVALLGRDTQTSTQADKRIVAASHVAHLSSLLLLIILYVVAVCMAFALPRFFLPLAPIYALAAAWTCWMIYRRLQAINSAWSPAIALVGTLLLIWLLAPGFGVGTRYVIDGQPADEVAAVELIEANLRPDERVLVCIPPEIPFAKYGTVAHRGTLCPTDADGPTALQNANGATYLLWSDARGTPPLPDSALIGRTGPYKLYRLR